MADHNKPGDDRDIYNEVMSPSELFAARNRSHKIPVRGQKEFYPNDSVEQRQRLEHSLEEHFALMAEERVERLGNLVRGRWDPAEKIVELQSPAGKFWQTMGFSSEGKQLLLPEEALHLMECGSVQVFYQDLPMSIQDGYERFLSSSTVSLQQYQVYGHLKRLGYVVQRFHPGLEPTSYARQLNLSLSRERAARTLKRKRSTSVTSSCSPSPAASEPPAATSSAGAGRSWWTAEKAEEQVESGHVPERSSRWDADICFPDLGSGDVGLASLSSPDPSLLPGALTVGVCDVTRWTQRINLRKVKSSEKEEERAREERLRRGDVNTDHEVRRCKNWAEYRELLQRRSRSSQGLPEHLWNGEVTPLHDPRASIPTRQLLEKLRVIPATNLLEGASMINASDEWRISFSVFQPEMASDFKKSKPGLPGWRVCVCSFSGPVPDLRALKQLSHQSGDVPLVFAVVDFGDISFFTFKDFQLPIDIFP
ncbi:tRNA-splicing endonuclease subunit Sen54 isoform X2 [Synchiropus splendidus]|uniref:tRNA-splicing endonuclease subunit Sen54 isoform X2 n=1 Tax=Synchiropus splendidus TaxID=270530 RepID=UPI00237DAB79|nr:tRNA-splicing endonuclease subunit Sen54 isoform X2 [Synchiropus splendidus]